MTVYIRRDGSLLRAQITEPSDQAALNLAARRIVELATPFAPCPNKWLLARMYSSLPAAGVLRMTGSVCTARMCNKIVLSTASSGKSRP